MGGVFNSAKNGVTNAVRTVSNGARNLEQRVENGVKTVSHTVQDGFHKSQELVEDGLHGLEHGAEQVGHQVKNFGNGVADWGKDLWETGKGIVENPGDTAKAMGKLAWSGVELTPGVGQLVDVAQGAIQHRNPMDISREKLGTLYEVGKGVVTDLNDERKEHGYAGMLGKLAPDILMTVGTGGSGAAAKGGLIAAKGARVLASTTEKGVKGAEITEKAAATAGKVGKAGEVGKPTAGSVGKAGEVGKPTAGSVGKAGEVGKPTAGKTGEVGKPKAGLLEQVVARAALAPSTATAATTKGLAKARDAVATRVAPESRTARHAAAAKEGQAAMDKIKGADGKLDLNRLDDPHLQEVAGRFDALSKPLDLPKSVTSNLTEGTVIEGRQAILKELPGLVERGALSERDAQSLVGDLFRYGSHDKTPVLAELKEGTSLERAFGSNTGPLQDLKDRGLFSQNHYTAQQAGGYFSPVGSTTTREAARSGSALPYFNPADLLSEATLTKPTYGLISEIAPAPDLGGLAAKGGDLQIHLPWDAASQARYGSIEKVPHSVGSQVARGARGAGAAGASQEQPDRS